MVLPPKVVNYNVLVLAMLDNIRAQGVAFDPKSEGRKYKYMLPPAGGDDEKMEEKGIFFPWVKFEVEDHAVSPPQKRYIYVSINHIVGDTRGWTGNTGHKAAPCINGMCPICNQLGVNNKAGRTHYPAGVRHLSGQRYKKHLTLTCIYLIPTHLSIITRYMHLLTLTYIYQHSHRCYYAHTHPLNTHLYIYIHPYTCI